MLLLFQRQSHLEDRSDLLLRCFRYFRLFHLCLADLLRRCYLVLLLNQQVLLRRCFLYYLYFHLYLQFLADLLLRYSLNHLEDRRDQ